MVIVMGEIKYETINPIKAFFSSKSYISKYVFENLEEYDLSNEYDIGLVLGCKNYEIMQKRILTALELYNANKIKLILLSGGIGYFSKHMKNSEAEVMKKFLLKNGIKENTILIDDKSRDTYENIKNSISLISKRNIKISSVLLITSDWHVKRAIGVFKTQSSLHILPYIVKDNLHDKDLWQQASFRRQFQIRLESFLLAWYIKRGYIKK